jgi:hypothetical protein
MSGMKIDAIYDFLGELDDLKPDEFKEAVSGILLELQERARYQIDKHDLSDPDFQVLLQVASTVR